MREQNISHLLEREWHELLGLMPPERVNSPRWFCGGAMPRSASGVALFAELEEVRRLAADLRASPDVQEYADRLVTSEWTLKDVLAHLASWATEISSEVQKAIRGEGFDYVIPFTPPRGMPDQWNAVEVEKRRHQPLAALFDEFARETARLQELVLELPDATFWQTREFPLAMTGDPGQLLRAEIGELVSMKCWHNHHHFARIRRWLAEQAQQKI